MALAACTDSSRNSVDILLNDPPSNLWSGCCWETPRQVRAIGFAPCCSGLKKEDGELDICCALMLDGAVLATDRFVRSEGDSTQT